MPTKSPTSTGKCSQNAHTVKQAKLVNLFKRLHNTASGQLFINKSLVKSLTIQLNGKALALTTQLSEKALLVPKFVYIHHLMIQTDSS
jgi:hypothetical protein